MMKRLIAMEIDDVIDAHSVIQELAGHDSPREQMAGSQTEADSIHEFMERHLAKYLSTFSGKLPPDGMYDRILEEVEPPLIRAVLSATRGNQLKAADVLGINRNTLRAKIKQHNINMIRGFAQAQ